MRLRLWHRMFALTALATLGALATMLAVQQHGFRSGLLDYVNQIDRERAQRLIPGFAGEHRSAGGWERLRDNPMRFRRLIEQGRADGPPDDELPPLQDLPPDPPPPPADERGAGAADADRSRPPRPRRHDGPPPGGFPGMRPPRDRPPPLGADDDPSRRRFALYDADGTPVIGPPGSWPDAVVLPIHIEGKVVGNLHMRPLPKLESSWDIDFARSQLRLGLITALLALLLAMLATLVFARRLARPLNWMADRAKRIAGGDYAARVQIARDDEIGELARDFDAMAQTLERNRDARRRWTAEISHELRTPIAVMRAELDALQDGIRPFNAQAVRSLSGEADRLSRLVEDLYQLSLADAGALNYQFERCDLSELLRDAAKAHAASFERARLRLELKLPAEAWIRADANRVGQLLGNLFANSCRYTDAGGHVQVNLTAGADGWSLSIDDSAPGVPSEALARLFDPLFRVETSRNRADGGAGLGLAIVQRIVQAHGARVDAQPSSLGGLRILIEWPRA